MIRQYTGTAGQLIFNSSGRRIPFVGLDGQMIGYANTNLFFGVSDWSRQGSDIAVDPTDDTLWSVDDTTGQQLISNISKGMSSDDRKTWDGSVIDPSITELEGVTVNPHDGTLYFLDDTPDLSDGVESRIWHCDRNCAPIRPGFNLSVHGVTSGQAIEYDIQDDTILIVCNSTKAVYRVDAQTFDLISVTDLGHIPNQPRSWQGIAIDTRTGFWWLSAYDPNTIILIDPSDVTAVLQSINVTNSSFSAVNIGHVAGIAFDPEGVGIPYEDITPVEPEPDTEVTPVAISTAQIAATEADKLVDSGYSLADALSKVEITDDVTKTVFIAAFVKRVSDWNTL